ncbi:MAG: tRNA (N6-threonylcarbamoyladenosine(37)-N6)-methyltransferase TrmO [Candidatus Bathyarchaeia archaeon]
MARLKKVKIEYIGSVKRASPNENVKDKNLISKIVLRGELAEALDGIEDYSHIFVIFWLHKVSDGEKLIMKVHPQAKLELPLTGIFATRTPNRPNPVGLTLVRLLKRDGETLWVKGLDAFDGTPVLDIKPYYGEDISEDIRVPRWMTRMR